MGSFRGLAQRVGLMRALVWMGMVDGWCLLVGEGCRGLQAWSELFGSSG